MEDGSGFLLFPVIALSEFSCEQCITGISDCDRVYPPESPSLTTKTPTPQDLSDRGLHTSISTPGIPSSPVKPEGTLWDTGASPQPISFPPTAPSTLQQPNELNTEPARASCYNHIPFSSNKPSSEQKWSLLGMVFVVDV